MHVLKLKPKKRMGVITIKKKEDQIQKKSFLIIRKNLRSKHLENLKTVLKYSNATPIRKYGCIGYTCSYCDMQYTEPSSLKKHTLDTHNNESEKIFVNNNKPFTHIKLDITDLKCSICLKPFIDLQLFIDHLVMDHKKSFYSDVPPHMITFKFESTLLKCHLCKIEYGTFKMLLEHMNSHYENYVCDVCGKGFIAKSILQTHLVRHKTGVFKCQVCDKHFDTSVKQKEHTRAVHVLQNKRSKCGYCGEKFTDYTKKNDHVVKMHGGKLLVLQCKACDKTFDNQRALNFHIKKCHSIERRKP